MVSRAGVLLLAVVTLAGCHCLEERKALRQLAQAAAECDRLDGLVSVVPVDAAATQPLPPAAPTLRVTATEISFDPSRWFASLEPRVALIADDKYPTGSRRIVALSGGKLPADAGNTILAPLNDALIDYHHIANALGVRSMSQVRLVADPATPGQVMNRVLASAIGDGMTVFVVTAPGGLPLARSSSWSDCQQLAQPCSQAEVVVANDGLYVRAREGSPDGGHLCERVVLDGRPSWPHWHHRVLLGDEGHCPSAPPGDLPTLFRRVDAARNFSPGCPVSRAGALDDVTWGEFVKVLAAIAARDHQPPEVFSPERVTSAECDAGW